MRGPMGSRGSAKSGVQIFGLWHPITSEHLIQTISSLYSNWLVRSRPFHWWRFRTYRSAYISANYTVKNRCFDMCWPYNNKMCVQGICICLEKPEVEIYRKWISIICVIEMSGIIIIILILIRMTMFMVLSSRLSHFENSPGSSDVYADQRQMAANPQTRPTDLGCESACRLLYGLHTSSPFKYYCITQLESWYSFYRPTEGGRLSQPRHTACSPI